MKTYQYHSQIFRSDVQVSYNKQGILCGFIVMDASQIESLHTQEKQFKNFYYQKDFLGEAALHKLKFTEVQRVVTFEMFWIRYNHKDCGRAEGLKAWNKLSKEDQIDGFDFIPRYESILKQPPFPAKLYATTYLNKKRWK